MPSSKLPQTADSEQIFISHAVVDHDLVNFFVDELLVGGVGLLRAQIFNTSAAASPIAAGDNFNPRIRQAMAGCRVVIALVSPNFYRSPFCMSELGAAWAAGKLMPILIPPVDFKSLEGVLQGVQCIRIGDKKKLFEIYDRIDWFQRNPSGLFATKVEEFLSGLPERLQKLPAPDVVGREDYRKLEERIAELSAKLQAAAGATSEIPANPGTKNAAQVPPKHGMVQLLGAAGNAGPVPLSYADFEEGLRQLVESANRIASSVPSVIQRLVYAHVLGDDSRFQVYPLEDSDWEKSLGEGLVRRDVFGEPQLNFKSARVSHLYDVYVDVREYLKGSPRERLYGYEVKHRHVPDLGEPEFARKWFQFWWEDNPADVEIPF